MTVARATRREPVDDDTARHTLAELALRLDEILDEIRALRYAVEHPTPRSTLSREDRALLTRLLPAIGGAVGSELFNSAEICGEYDAAALRLVCAGLSARQVGRLLRRAAGTPIAGYLVERVGLEAGAVLWRVVRVPEFLSGQNSRVPCGESDDSRD